MGKIPVCRDETGMHFALSGQIAQRGIDRRETFSMDADRPIYLRLVQQDLVQPELSCRAGA